jgi:hypothetical protein
MELLRRITLLGNLNGVEPKLSFQVGRLVLRIPYRVALFLPQLGILDRNRLIHRQGMAADV